MVLVLVLCFVFVWRVWGARTAGSVATRRRPSSPTTLIHRDSHPPLTLTVTPSPTRRSPQINCTRDTHGNVVEGGEEDVQRIYYYWALEMEAQPYVGEDDKVHPPRWRLREMLVRGMHNLL